MVGEQIIFKNAEFCFCMYFIHLQVPYINNISSKAMPTFGQQQQQELSPLYPSLILVGVVVFIGLYSCFVLKRWKYIVLKNLKVHYRSKKYHYILAAFIISYLYTFIMAEFVQSLNQKSRKISYCACFYFILIVVTILEFQQEHKEQSQYFMLHHAQGLTFAKYFFSKIYCYIILSLVLAILNALSLNIIIGIQSFPSNLLLIYSYFLAMVSTFSITILFSLAFNYLSGLRYLFVYFMLQATLLCINSNFLDDPLQIDGFGKFASGFYIYCSNLGLLAFKLKVQEDKKIEQLIQNFQYQGLQILMFYGLYLLLMFYKLLNWRLKYIQKKSKSSSSTLLDSIQSDEDNQIIRMQNGSKWIGFNCCIKRCRHDYFKDVNKTIHEQELFIVVGNNDINKSDFLDTISGVQCLSSGKIYQRQNLKIGICHSKLKNYYQELNFMENIQYFANLKGINLLDNETTVIQLVDKFCFDKFKYTRASSLSASSRKKLDLACTFVGYNELLILDQPSKGLSESFRMIFWKNLKQIIVDQQRKQQKYAIVLGSDNLHQFLNFGNTIFTMKDCREIFFEQHNLYLIKIKHKNNQQFNKNFKTLFALQIVLAVLQPNTISYQENKQKLEIQLIVSSKHLLTYQQLFMVLIQNQYCSVQRTHVYFNKNNQMIQRILQFKFDLNKLSTFRKFVQFLKRRYILELSNNKRFIYAYLLVVQLCNGLQRGVIYKTVPMLGKIIFRKVIFILISEIGYGRFRQMQHGKSSSIKKIYHSSGIYQLSWLTFDFLLYFVFIVQILDYYTFLEFFFNFAYSIIYLICSYILASIFHNYASYLFVLLIVNGQFLFYIEGYSFEFLSNLKYFYFPITYTAFYQQDSGQQWLFLTICIQMLIFIFIYICFQRWENIKSNKAAGIQSNLRDFIKHQYALNQQYDAQNGYEGQNVLFIAKNISKSLTKDNLNIKNFCLKLRVGDIYGLLGGNSSGKSIIFKMLAGFITPSQGNISFNKHLVQSKICEEDHFIGICPSPQFIDNQMLVWNMVKLYGSIKGLNTKAVQNFTGFYLHYFDCLNILKRQMNTLTASHYDLVCILLAFIGNPKVLLFDKPTARLLQSHKKKFWDFLLEYVKKNKVAVFFTSDDADEIENYCNKFGYLSEGELMCVDNPEKIIKKFEQLYKLVFKYKRQQDIDYIQKQVEKWQRDLSLQVEHLEQSSILIYSLKIKYINFKLVMEDVIQRLLKEGLIEYFEFYRQKLKHIIKRHFSERNSQNIMEQDQG